MPATTGGSAPDRRVMVGEPVYSVPGTSVTVSPAGVRVVRTSTGEKREKARASVDGLRADWETEDDGEKSSPDSGLGRPESGAPRRSPAGSPVLRAGATGTSTSGLSSGAASSVCGSTGG